MQPNHIGICRIRITVGTKKTENLVTPRYPHCPESIIHKDETRPPTEVAQKTVFAYQMLYQRTSKEILNVFESANDPNDQR